ncbi:hypothetical protein E1B28_002736 [Marasmius oreades]|uniref:Uncharacterized protein n=1 Tax=Marasmius oreades TaxID=181124 RepID=A0A9P7RNZ6_9AGAR|nr:uncharacterized protein E1B28_002736 [Marasmius oreades]KAG7086812.1 hypothetical protein E1B28_002736 [Marasmius oreades]
MSSALCSSYTRLSSLSTSRSIIFGRRNGHFSLVYTSSNAISRCSTLRGCSFIFTTNMSVRYCTSTFNVATWSFIIGSMLSEILTIRLWAVWERSFWVGIGLVGFFFACWVPCCVFMASFLGAVKFGTPPIPDFWGCFIVGGSEIIYMCWVLIMVYDTGTLVMILIPGVAAYRRGGRSQLSKTIYQDGVMYYALLSFCAMINVIIVFTLPHDLRLLLASFERVLHSILASRAILHIRQVASERSIYRTMSEIEFSRNGQENEHGTLPSLQSSDGSLAVG